MIWNEKILFLHVPKTAGMSITSLLLKSLKGDVHITGPYEDRREGSVTYLPGKRHETLCDAESALSYRNLSLSGFEKVFAVMRNPYSLEVSRYSYLRREGIPDKGPARDIACAGDFKEYLRRAPFFGMSPPRLHMYYELSGQIPANLVVLKYEQLLDSVAWYMSPYLENGYRLEHENRSMHGPYEEVYDAESEQLCFERHRWFFEKGFYQRMSLLAVAN